MMSRQEFESLSCHVNPRVLLWLRSVGLTPADIARSSGADVVSVADRGQRLPWTLVFVEWIGKAWREWAATLGYTKGADPHRLALLAGHTDSEFNAWLAEREGL